MSVKDKTQRIADICRFINKHNLTGPQLSVLALVPDHSPTEISKITEEKLSNIYPSFQSLKKRGYLNLRSNPEKIRDFSVSVTEKGEEAQNELNQLLL